MDQLTIATHSHKLELWIDRIRACMTSGQTVSDWCEVNGINVKTYYYWMRKIKREAFDSLPATRKKSATLPHRQASPFVEISMSEVTSATSVRVYLTKAIVDIPDSTSSVTISDILNVVSKL